MRTLKGTLKAIEAMRKAMVLTSCIKEMVKYETENFKVPVDVPDSPLYGHCHDLRWRSSGRGTCGNEQGNQSVHGVYRNWIS